MKIFGRGVSEYLAFQKVLVGLIVVFGIVCLVLSMAGVSDAVVMWFSMTGLVFESCSDPGAPAVRDM